MGLCGQLHVPAHVQPADVSDVLAAVCLWLLSVHKVHCSRKALGKPLQVGGRLPLILVLVRGLLLRQTGMLCCSGTRTSLLMSCRQVCPLSVVLAT